jgi:hypothetical protein
VVFTNLEEELRNRAIDIPEDLFIEDFFRGDLPDLSELTRWLTKLKERSRGSSRDPVPTPAKTPAAPKAAAPSASPSAAASKDVKPKPSASSSSPGLSVTQVRSASESRKLATSKASDGTKEKSQPKAAQSARLTLSSEGDEWADYLEDLASKQGKTFETGFVGLDGGGLTTGLLVLADEEQARRCGFLKQLTDQVALRSQVPCLFLSFDTSKTILRIRTLARLSGVPAKDIEKGRLKKDSPEWENVEGKGRQAAGWLKRVFVVEAGPDTGLPAVRETARELVRSAEESTGLIVVDNLEKLSQGDSTRDLLRQLKALSDSLDVLVVVATVNKKLLSESSVDFAADLSGDERAGLTLEFTRTGDSVSSTLRFRYQPGIHKFTEQ